MCDNEDTSPVFKSAKIINADCCDCPYLRLYHYPVCYCLHSIVDESTLCPYDYDLRVARIVYKKNIECIEYWDKFVKRQLFGTDFSDRN